MKSLFLFLGCVLMVLSARCQVFSGGLNGMYYSNPDGPSNGRVASNIELRYNFFEARNKYNLGVGLIGPFYFSKSSKTIVTGVEALGSIRYLSKKRVELHAGLRLKYLYGEFTIGEIPVDLGYAYEVKKKNALDMQISPVLIQLYPKKQKKRFYWSVEPSAGFLYTFGNIPVPNNPPGEEKRPSPFCFSAEIALIYHFYFKN